MAQTTIESTTNNNSLLLECFSQKMISEDLTYKNVNRIIDYEIDLRVTDMENPVSDKFEFDISVSPFIFNNVSNPVLIDDRNYSTIVHSWTGYVTSIKEDVIIAVMQDNNSNNSIKEEAEININDLDAEDAQNIEIGSVFYWSIGYGYRNGTKTKESFIRLKRLPSFSQLQIDKAIDWSSHAFENLNWDL